MTFEDSDILNSMGETLIVVNSIDALHKPRIAALLILEFTE